ncbi:MAG: hypothetical protein EOO77_39425 [Oxalobacteraceae bacterium]|nr:MAG: hypothetical protein EOO77_39425 [Oxalobacteraceae bacterium]
MAVWLKARDYPRENQFTLCPHEALPNYRASITEIEEWCGSPERPGLWFWFYSGADHRYHLWFSDAATAVECRIRWG